MKCFQNVGRMWNSDRLNDNQTEGTVIHELHQFRKKHNI